MLGFGKGKLELTVSNLIPAFGEMISRTATMQLKDIQTAKGFFVELLAERRVTRRVNRNGRLENDTDTETVYRAPQQLGPEGQFGTQPYQFNFQFKVPMQSEIPGATAGGFWSTLSGVSRPEWFVVAKLDIPKGFDLSKKVKINVR